MALIVPEVIGFPAVETVFLIGLAIVLLYYPAWVVYTLLFHPLSRFPGPKLAAISPVVHLLWDVQGKQHTMMKEMHDKYGDVVRIAPNVLSYRAAPAWKDIYGHTKKGRHSFTKDPSFYPIAPRGFNSIITADDEEHPRMRRVFAYAFSPKALGEQEDILHAYVDVLIQKLRVMQAPESPAVDMVRWFNFTTFDLMGDLGFGESFGCLDSSNYHWWVSIILVGAIKASVYLKIFFFYPMLKPLAELLIPKGLLKQRADSLTLSAEKIRRRFETQSVRPDFASYVISHGRDDNGSSFTQAEIEANAALLVVAGSETTAALLSGCVYFLLRDQDRYRRLVQEIREAFKQVSDIKLAKLVELPYLNAVLTESLRIYPPVPAMLPRIVPKGGALINGRFVPGDVSVAVSLYAAFNSSTNFLESESFIPERWLPGPESARFASDNKDAMQPFSYGPRNCVGQHLANAEMRLILSKLLWNFDLALAPESLHWADQKSYSLWSRPPLMVKVLRARG